MLSPELLLVTEVKAFPEAVVRDGAAFEGQLIQNASEDRQGCNAACLLGLLSCLASVGLLPHGYSGAALWSDLLDCRRENHQANSQSSIW